MKILGFIIAGRLIIAILSTTMSSLHGKSEISAIRWKVSHFWSISCSANVLAFPRVISHRGGGDRAPENTVLAIETGAKYGIPAVEFDVMLSKDKVPMLMHDEELSRLVIDPKYKSFSFNQLTASELKTVNVGQHYDRSLTDVFIPTFEEVLQYCLEHHIFMNIEIKPATGFDLRTGIIVTEMVAEYYDRLADAGIAPILSSFSFDALKAAKEVAPHIPRGLLIHEPLNEAPGWQQQLIDLRAAALHVNHEHLTPALVAEIKALRCGVFCYTVNDLQRAEELLSWGVDCLCTDNIAVFSPLALKLRR
jgi:glycerophosphoryl diester phosphodiesterase